MAAKTLEFTRAAANVSVEKNEKTKISKDIKSKKQVAGDLFVCNCHAYLTTTALYHGRSICSYMADFFEP